MKIFNKLAFSIIFCGLCFCLLSSCRSSEDSSAQEVIKPEKIVTVAIEKLQLDNLTETFTLPANLEAWEDLSLAAETAGTVQKINFKEGDRVKANQVLLEIDPETIKSFLYRDQQNVAVIERKLNRYQILEEDGLVSQQELDDLENRLTAARATLQTTRLQLQKSSPRAPVSGIVDRLYVDRGEYVDPGRPLLRLVQVEKLKVIADVPEKDVPFLEIGQSVEIIPAAINTQSAASIPGVIEYIAFSANPTTRTYRTKIVIDNGSAKLRPGMIVRAEFIRQRLDQVISIPLFAVMDREGEKIVFLAENGVAKKVKVVTGSSVGQRIVIKQGLSANQTLIVKGQQLLADGTRIVVGEN